MQKMYGNKVGMEETQEYNYPIYLSIWEGYSSRRVCVCVCYRWIHFERLVLEVQRR